MLVRNPETGALINVKDPAPYLQQGYTEPTDAELEKTQRELTYGTTGQQVQAQAERVGRGLTLGQFEGVGTPEEIRARDEVSRELSPVTSFAADVAPALAVGAATGGLAGAALGVEAGVGASTAARLGVLAAGELGGGAVQAAQTAHEEGRQFLHEDIGRDVEQTALWAGLGTALGGVPIARQALKTGKTGAKAAVMTAEEVAETAAAAEGRAVQQAAPAAAEAAPVAQGAADATTGPPAGERSPAYQRAREMIDQKRARAGEEGAVIIGRQTTSDSALESRYAHGISNELANNLDNLREIVDPEASVARQKAAIRKYLTTKLEDQTVEAGEKTGRAAINKKTLGKAVEPYLDELVDMSAHLEGLSERYWQEFGEKTADGSTRLRPGAPTSLNEYLSSGGGGAYGDTIRAQRDALIEKAKAAGGERSPAYQRARELIDQRRAQSGGVDIGPASPKVAKLQAKLDQQLGKLRELEDSAPAGVTDDLGANDISDAHAERVSKARDQVQESLYSLHDELSGRIDDTLQGRAPEELGPKARAKYDRFKASLDELDQHIGEAGGGAEDVGGIASLSFGDDPAKVAESYLAKRGQRGVAEVGTGIGDILTSPIGATTVGAGAGIAADQLGLDPEQAGLVGLGVAGATALLGHGRGLSALSRLERKGAGAAAESAAKEAAENGMSRAVRNASKADAEDIIAKATRGAVEAEPEASSIFRDRRLYQNRQAILDSATKEMQADIGSAVKEARALTENQVPRAAGKVSDNLAAQRQTARTMAENASKWSGQLKAEAKVNAYRLGKGGMQYAAPEEKALTLALIENAQQIGKAKTGKEMFESINALKDATSYLKDKLASIETRSPAQERLLAKLDDFSSTVKRGLEDNKTWGSAGDILAAHHQTAGELVPGLDAFEKEGMGKNIRPLLESADPAARTQVGKLLDAMTANAEASLKFGGDRAKAEAVIAKADKIRRTMGLADEVADATGRMQTIGKAADTLPFVGKSVKGLITGDLGSAYQRLTQATDAAVGRGVDDWIRSSKIRGGGRIPALLRKLPQLSPEQRALVDVAKRRGVTVGMAKFMGNDDSPQKAFERRRDALLDEDSFFERVSGDFAGLQEQSPEAMMLLSGKVAEARQFLIDRMPANVAVSVARPGGYPPSREAVEDWSIYWNAVEHPIDTVKNLAGMRIQEAETIQKLYPRLWEQTQQTVLEKIGTAQSGGDPLDDTMLMRLDLMFGFDGAGSTAFSSRAAKTGASAQPAAPPGGGSSRAPTDAKRMTAATPSLTGATMGTVG